MTNRRRAAAQTDARGRGSIGAMRSPRGRTLAAALVLTVGGLIAPATVAAADPVIVGAGDIASCSATADSATAKLLDGIAGTVVALGDNAYPSGTAAQFRDCYAPTWGRHKARTRPAAGNHDYETAGAERLLRLLRRRRRRPGEGLLQLRPRDVAHRRAQLELRGDRRLQRDLAAGGLAAGRPRGQPGHGRPRLLAPSRGSAPACTATHRAWAAVLGDRSTRPAPTSSSTATTTTTSGSRRRTRGAAPTPRTASASSSSAPAARSCGRACLDRRQQPGLRIGLTAS